MIELYLAILLFGVGTYLGKNSQNQIVSYGKKNSKKIKKNKKNKKNNLDVYSQNEEEQVDKLQKEYVKKLDSKCREIIPRDFTGLLNSKSKKEYEKRKLSEIGISNEIDNEILKYEPKNNKFITSKLTGATIPINKFTKSSTVAKDGNAEDDSMQNWALPYFGGKATQSMKVESFQNKLETFTGSSKFNFHKKEIKPLFVPNKNVTFVNGSPIYNDDVKNRFVQSNYRNTELPFEQQKVGSGVGQNYGNKGVGGFHQFEIQDIVKPKTVDELRTLSNPKTTYKQPILSGKGIDARSSDVNVKKYKPDKFYTNSPSKYFTTTGSVLKDKSPETFILKNTSRAISKQIVGAAAPGSNVKPYKTPNFKSSTRNNYVNSGLRNLHVPEAWDGLKELSDYGKKGILLGPNERDTTQKQAESLNVVDSVKAIIAPLLDKMRKTRKENIIGNPNAEGYMAVNIPNKQTVYDPNDIARTTIKETTLHETGNQNLTHIKKQTVYDPNDVAKTTVKETTLYESGNQNLTFIKKQTIYDPNDIAKTTIKETTLHDTHDIQLKGPIKMTVYDPNDIARTTIKETTLHESGNGNLRPGRPEKSPNYDIDPLKNTIKETTIDNIHHTNVNYTNGDGYGYLTNEFDAPATQKQFTSNNEYGGNVSSNINNKGGYLSNKFDAPATQKQFTSDNDYTGSANSYSKATQDYTSAKNMITNALKEKVSKGRSFTQHGTKVFNGEDYMNVLNKKQNATINYQNQTNVGKTYQIIPGKEISKSTNKRVPLANIPDIERTNPKILNQLNSNPFAININRGAESVIETDYSSEDDFI